MYFVQLDGSSDSGIDQIKLWKPAFKIFEMI